tara:strand:+ start:663 stop:1385 length:723 start_codon:yes stop_codon:yes gene_type:complete
MKAIILAAGKGTRLEGLQNIKHKSLLKINNISLIERQIKILKKNNIHDVYIITGHNSEEVEKELSEYNVKFLFNKNFEKTDTLESFLVAKKIMNDELITLYADVIFEEEILLELLASKNSNIILSIEQINCERDDMKTLVDDDKIKKIDKNLTEGDFNSRYQGIARFSREGAKIFREFLEKFEQSKSLEGDVSRVFEEIIKKHTPIHANFIKNYVCINVNTAILFYKAQEYFETRSSNTF